MTWVKLDASFPRHPKVLAAGDKAAWVYICGLCYSAEHLTDGFIPLSVLRRFTDVSRPLLHASKLVSVGLWEEIEGGFLIHDYVAHQRSKADVLAGREAAATRMQRVRSPKVRANTEGTSPEPRAKFANRVEEKRVEEENNYSAQARWIATRHWDETTPKPNVPFPALITRCKELLEAGWSEQDIRRGLSKTRAYSRNAIEFVMRQPAAEPKGFEGIRAALGSA